MIAAIKPAARTYPSRMSSSEYVLGTDEAEFHRLGFQHRLWSDLAHRTWMNAGIRPGMTVLDAGCGPGYAAFDLAQIVGPEGRVIAVDASESFIARLREGAKARGITNIEAHVLDVRNLGGAGLQPASIDLAWSRWVLCFVPDPAAVIRSVARLLKPGGRFCVNDYFNYESMALAPRRPAFERGIAAVARSWRDHGGDPDIIARLPRLCADAGLRTTRLELDHRVALPGGSMWQWPDTFWPNFIPRLVASGHLPRREADEFFAAWREASSDPHSFMLLPPVFEFIAERE